jgi:hypothetical protein
MDLGAGESGRAGLLVNIFSEKQPDHLYRREKSARAYFLWPNWLKLSVNRPAHCFV